MNSKSGLALVLLAACIGFPSGTHAQVLDHLECFKVKDPGSFSAFVDLQSLEYGTASGCRVKVKAKFYCVPSTKTVTETTAPEEDIDGPPQFGPQVCYTIQSCPDAGPAEHEVTDQFGHRTLENVKRKLVCAPAIAGAPPTTTTTLPSCGPAEGGVACNNSTSGACATCCSGNVACSVPCGVAAAGGCFADLLNIDCANGANVAGCAEECCP